MNNALASEGVFTTNIGKRALCLDAEEYERVAGEIRERGSLAESVVLAEKDAEIKALKTALASMTEDKSRLEAQNAARHQPAASTKKENTA